MYVFDARGAIIDSDIDSSFDYVFYYAIKTKLSDVYKPGLKYGCQLIYQNFSFKPELDILSFDKM